MSRQNHLLLIDCRSCKTELVPTAAAAVSLIIINTNVRHEFTDGGYAQRRVQCEMTAKILNVSAFRDATSEMLALAKNKMDEVVFWRARHVIGENERTVQAAEGVRASNWSSVDQLMYASHVSLHDDCEVSSKELDVVVEIAEGISAKGGIYGCRMTGGGFGGCAVARLKRNSSKCLLGRSPTAITKKLKSRRQFLSRVRRQAPP